LTALPKSVSLRPVPADERSVIELVRAERLLAIVRYRDGGDVDGALAALAAGGVRLAEVTIDSPGALEAVAEAARRGRPVGVGTVTTAAQVTAAAEAGARFVVSPGLVPDVVRTALALGLEPLPGAFTPTEILHARSLGATLVKLFPAGALGPEYVRAVRAPLADVDLVPTGGLRVEDVAAYLHAGATAVALGSGLAGRRPPVTAGERDDIAERAAAAVAAVHAASPEVPA
jgi:2-dehydro-3-deoxyphosphogluconate aldolase/(4S)-4-hydroxy-2-oxoglutarate aldolase